MPFRAVYHDPRQFGIERQLAPLLAVLEWTVRLEERLLREEQRLIEFSLQFGFQFRILGTELGAQVVPVFSNDMVEGKDGMEGYGSVLSEGGLDPPDISGGDNHEFVTEVFLISCT